MSRDVIIRAVKQISIQNPLSESWMDTPLPYGTEDFAVSVDPDFKPYVPGMQARRMGRLLKRAVAVTSEAMAASGITCPDAVIAATGLGCIENTEAFLNEVCDGEEMLKPTYFMQSTHNTIASALAIRFGCHGYNSTYSHGSVSFESALYDAYLQIRGKEAETVLVGGFDEITPSYYVLLRKCGFVLPGTYVCSEAAVAMMLSGPCLTGNGICRVEAVRILHRPSEEELEKALHAVCGGIRPDAVMTEPDPIADRMLPGVPQLRYKHIFGECYTASALGVYAAAVCIGQGRIPGTLCPGVQEAPDRILFLNHTAEDNVALVLLTRI
ncbi:MAG TPA: beta-ketoacyl synthase chain length factor [Candidatus Coprenecus pullistercoris]|nr:beta-ketoacyl synthase chain length factor [Candidatus Coprenecus pullistercoris]